VYGSRARGKPRFDAARDGVLVFEDQDGRSPAWVRRIFARSSPLSDLGGDKS
jgi:hypothetical protein